MRGSEAVGVSMIETKEPGSTGGISSLHRNFSWVLAGNLVYAASQWGMLTALAKLGSPEMVGQFGLGLAITAPIILFSNLNLLAAQSTDARREYAFGDYAALRTATTALALVLIFLLVAFGGYARETALVVLLIGVSKAVESFSDLTYGLYMQRERMDYIARSMVLRGLLSLVALSAGVYLTGGVAWGVVGMCVVWAAVFLLHDAPNVRSVLERGESARVVFRPAVLASLAWLALPLGLVMTLVSLYTNVPRYFIQGYFGEREVGFFTAMSYIIVAGSTFVNALGQAASPRLAGYYADGDTPAYRSLLVKAVGLGAGIGVAGILAAVVAGPEILTVLYSAEYAAESGVFTLLMVAAAFGYVASFLGYGMTAARYFKTQIPLFGATVASVVVSCWLLVPAFGLAGAAFSLIIGGVVQTAGGLLAVSHAVNSLQKREV
ncbi:lipopolysaccharide biosynthesis protein [Rubrobacter indicoceani]|uniref:lipopolysaccharide biosynthesis protein n=1 Tax=Rubrobacter indicoceani TaxID=2051957 RepID=UPI0019693A1C|nr:oligosaccharide flippase family protein [Rubrobacter indicoceani]